MRVQSDHQFKNGGYRHKLDQANFPEYIPEGKRQGEYVSPHELGRRMEKWLRQTTMENLMELSRAIKVDPVSLNRVGCVWAQDHHCYAFPMFDPQGHTIGIRLRAIDGKKFSVTGSRSGLFYNSGHDEKTDDRTLYIVEGATDCAAAIQIGLWAIGRPSCLGSEDDIQEFIEIQKVRRVVIISDNDEQKTRPDGSTFYPGQDGAFKLQSRLQIPSVVFIPPTKDFRDFVINGGSRIILESCIKSMVWRNPKI